MKKEHLVVIGGMRSGTTSLFRYLCNSGQIAPSYIKELNYFIGSELAAVEYLKNFKKTEKSIYTLESSPVYLAMPKEFIRGVLETGLSEKIIPIVIVRRTLDRLESVYYSTVRSGVVSNVGISKFLKDAAYHKSDLSYVEVSHREYMDGVMNLGQMESLTMIKDSMLFDKIYWIDFDDLTTDPVGLVARLSKITGVDFFDFNCNVENKSIVPKYPYIYKTALYLNSLLEPVLNKFPSARNFIREVHHTVNSKQKKDFSNNELINLCFAEDVEVNKFLSDNEIFVKV